MVAQKAMIPEIIATVGLPIAYGLIVVTLFVTFIAFPVSVYSRWRDMRNGTYLKKVNGISKSNQWKK